MAAVTNAHLLEAILGLTEAIKAQHVVAAAPVAKAAKANTRTPKAAKALTRSTREAFIAASDYDFAGWSTKEIAQFCVENSYAPKGFCIGEGYTALYS